MPKFKRFRPHGLAFRLLLFLAGALMLLAAFAPRANADLIAYFNFEGTATPPYPVNLDSEVPPGFATTTLFLDNGTPGMPFSVGATSAEAGLPLNVAAGDPDPNNTSLGIHRSGVNPLGIEIPLFSGVGIYDVTSVSFAISANGNGYAFATLQYSTNGGGTFTNIGVPQPIVNGPGVVMTFAVPAGTTINQPTLILRLLFTGGQSNGADLQNQIDNIQVNGTIVPEPATVAGGLLGVLGLCFHQRRRLRSLGALPKNVARVR
jgi:hypothetical protein